MNTGRRIIWLYWQEIKKYKLSFFLMVVFIPLAALFLDTLLPYFLSLAVGTLSTSDVSTLHNCLIIAGIVAALGVIFNLMGFQSAIYHEARVRKLLNDNTLTKLLAKDQSFFANQKTGSLVSRFIDFVYGHIQLQDMFVSSTLRFIVVFGSGIAIIFYKAPLMGWISLGILAFIIAQVQISIKLRRPLRDERKNTTTELNGAIADSITNSLTVKTFANEKYEQKLIGKLTSKYRRAHIKDFRWMSFEGTGRLALMSVGQIITIGIIANMLFQGQLELGVAIFIVVYLQRIAGQIFSFGELLNGYDRIFLQSSPMAEYLAEEDQVNDGPNAKKIEKVKGNIDFSNLNYQYSDGNELVLNDLNIKIPAGQKVGLVGQSGAGKTTITKLLLRFDDPTNGKIEIDKQNIHDVTQESLRQNISYVPQEPMLFHRSIADNIAYGRPNASAKEIRQAAKKANALEFIEQLPNGFDTIVGERGVKLSGGQRQRVSIARAILKNAPILLLDEATSALDSESEALIQTVIQNRTSIVIAHRLSTISQLDRIIVLENGKIIEDGTHSELLKNNGRYASLWKRQTDGFITED